jgi:hypothetical protein
VGAGTLTLSNGVDAPLRMVDIPSVRLMNEALADQVEVSQILAHRDSHADAGRPRPPTAPPRRPLTARRPVPRHPSTWEDGCRRKGMPWR